MAVAVAEQTETLRELKERKEEILKAIETEGDRLIQEYYKGVSKQGHRQITFRDIVENFKTLNCETGGKWYRLRGITKSGEREDVFRSLRRTKRIKTILQELEALFYLYKALRRV